MIAKNTNNIIYIVICAQFEDEPFFVDSVWTSERKAEKRKNELNSDNLRKWREDMGYSNFEVILQTVCK